MKTTDDFRAALAKKAMERRIADAVAETAALAAEQAATNVLRKSLQGKRLSLPLLQKKAPATPAADVNFGAYGTIPGKALDLAKASRVATLAKAAAASPYQPPAVAPKDGRGRVAEIEHDLAGALAEKDRLQAQLNSVTSEISEWEIRRDIRELNKRIAAAEKQLPAARAGVAELPPTADLVFELRSAQLHAIVTEYGVKAEHLLRLLEVASHAYDELVSVGQAASQHFAEPIKHNGLMLTPHCGLPGAEHLLTSIFGHPDTRERGERTWLTARFAGLPKIG